jgi:chromosomal replication initiation ATPase DnaA
MSAIDDGPAGTRQRRPPLRHRTELDDGTRVAMMSARPALASIKRAVAEAHGVTVAALEGRCRARRVCWVRHLAMLLAHREGYLVKQIGWAFGGRDHSTVSIALRRFTWSPPRR